MTPNPATIEDLYTRLGAIQQITEETRQHARETNGRVTELERKEIARAAREQERERQRQEREQMRAEVRRTAMWVVGTTIAAGGLAVAVIELVIS